MKKVLAVSAGLLLFAGCGSAEPAATVTVTSTVTAAPEGIREFTPDSLRELRIGLGTAGLVCKNWNELSEYVGECDGGTLISWVPETPDGLNLHKASINLSLNAIIQDNRTDVDMLVGPNWFVRVSAEAAPVLKERIGGVILGAVSTDG